ncbi:MAG: chromate transporter [Bryobacteraceae bacterium]|nr:chromate transporter [Bryobacteraceae bacterium]MDW8377351.1 chromate transporter [Bryobacterales bacterium]
MKLVLLYFLLLKATITSFSGLGSLPMIHSDLVIKHRILTERQLHTAVAAGRSGPGPIGLYVVAVGYAAAGVPGAIAGWLAMVTPAFLILPLLRYASQYAEDPRLKRVIQAVVLSSAGLLLSATIPFAREALEHWWTASLALISFLLTAGTRIDSAWVILASAFLGAISALLMR